MANDIVQFAFCAHCNITCVLNNTFRDDDLARNIDFIISSISNIFLTTQKMMYTFIDVT